MTKRRETKKKKYSFLFIHILIAVVFPMIFLLVGFNVYLFKLTRTSSEAYQVLEAKTTLLSLKDRYKPTLETANINQDAPYLKAQLETVREELNLEKISLIDPTKRRLLFEVSEETRGLTFKEGEANSIPNHLQEHVNKALESRRNGKAFYFVNATHKLYGYIPIWYKETRQVLLLISESPSVDLSDVLRKNRLTMQISSLLVVLIALIIVLYLTYRIVRPLQIMNRACLKIIGGDLGHQVKIKTGDEIEALADSFNKMTQGLQTMQSFAANANPLTKLPGNQVIKAEMLYRMKKKKPFVFFHADIDHFKAFNDAYGLEMGDQALKETGQVFKNVVKGYNREENFLGHQGGDDFVLILSPWDAKEIAEKICKDFDELIKKYYKKEDLERGYFETKDTRELSMNQEDAPLKKFPLMSISLAGISVTQAPVDAYDDILTYATSVKKKAKKVPYSYFVIDELKSHDLDGGIAEAV